MHACGDQKRVRCPVAGATGGSELPDADVENGTGSRRTLSTPNHRAISPAQAYFQNFRFTVEQLTCLLRYLVKKWLYWLLRERGCGYCELNMKFDFSSLIEKKKSFPFVLWDRVSSHHLYPNPMLLPQPLRCLDHRHVSQTQLWSQLYASPL